MLLRAYLCVNKALTQVKSVNARRARMDFTQIQRRLNIHKCKETVVYRVHVTVTHASKTGDITHHLIV